MNDVDLEPELRATGDRLSQLCNELEIDLWHKHALRAQLLRRHRELRTSRMTRLRRRWSASVGSRRRIGLVGLPAIAIATAFAVLVSLLQISGHPSPQAAEAARLTRALVKTVPTVTSWRVMVQQERGDAVVAAECPVRLHNPMYIRQGRTYLYLGAKRWRELAWDSQRVTLGRAVTECAVDLQWAFVMLPGHLTDHRFTILRARSGDGLEGIRYTLAGSKGLRSDMIAWVNPESGLLTVLNRVVWHGNRVVERDVAVYRYERTR